MSLLPATPNRARSTTSSQWAMVKPEFYRCPSWLPKKERHRSMEWRLWVAQYFWVEATWPCWGVSDLSVGSVGVRPIFGDTGRFGFSCCLRTCHCWNGEGISVWPLQTRAEGAVSVGAFGVSWGGCFDWQSYPGRGPRCKELRLSLCRW